MAMHALHVYPHSIEMMHGQDAPFEGIDIVQLAGVQQHDCTAFSTLRKGAMRSNS